MYKVINQKVKNKDVVCENYKNKLLKEGVLTENELKDIQNKIRTLMSDAYELSAHLTESELTPHWLGSNWAGLKGKDAQEIKEWDTSITKERAQYIADAISPSNFPQNVQVHKKLKNILDERSNSVLHSNGIIDWGTAEQLAYGSLLLEGNHVRVSGQDCERGTFSHRHCVIHDQEIDETEHYENRFTYIPLSQGLKDVV